MNTARRTLLALRYLSLTAILCGVGIQPSFSQETGRLIYGVGGKCLDAAQPEDGEFRAGTPVVLWDCHGGPNQQWLL